jgi:hypothetical protein
MMSQSFGLKGSLKVGGVCEFRSSALVQSILLRVWVVKLAKDLSQAEEDRKALGL